MLKQETIRDAAAKLGLLIKTYQKQQSGKRLTKDDELLLIWAAGDSSKVTATTAEFMHLLEANNILVTKGRLSQLTAEGALPQHQHDLWPVVDTLAGLARWWRRGGRDTREGVQKVRLRNQELEAELREIELHKAKREWVSMKAVDEVWGFITAELAARIRTADIPQAVKDDLLKQCAAVPVERYCNPRKA